MINYKCNVLIVSVVIVLISLAIDVQCVQGSQDVSFIAQRELRKAIIDNDFDRVGKIVENINLNVPFSEDGETPLITAVIAATGYKMSPKIINLLIDHGAFVNAFDSVGKAPLHYACISGSYSVTELLIKRGASVNLRATEKKVVPLHYALRHPPLGIDKDNPHIDYKKTAEVLLKHGADVLIKNSDGVTPLDMAIKLNDENILQSIKKLTATNKKALTLDRGELYNAITSDDYERASRLIQNINLNEPLSEMGEMALHTAVILKRSRLINLLIARGAMVNLFDSNGKLPLHYASGIGSYSIVGLLIKAGSLVNMKVTVKQWTPLHYAVSGASSSPFSNDPSINHKKTIEILIQHGADVFIKNGDRNTFANEDGDTPFEMAKIKKNIPDIVQIMDNMTSASQREQRDATKEIYAAIVAGSYERASRLIQYVSINEPFDDDGSMMLHTAVINDKQKIADMLIDHGASVNAFDNVGYTPLHWACNLGYYAIVEDLIKKGAKINIKATNKKMTPMHVAVFGASSIFGRNAPVFDLKALESLGATPPIGDPDRDYMKTLEILMKNGADGSIKNDDEETPMDIARKENEQDIIKFMNKSTSLTLGKTE